MKDAIKTNISKLHPKRLVTLTETFLRDESISGKIILVAALLSLIVVNSPFYGFYDSFWHQTFTIGNLSLDLRHWVNEALMAFFFLVVGLEIKRELVKGELRKFKTAILPIGAAVGGMIVPALVYFYFNMNTAGSNGWGIPIATDIAFAVAVLALIGTRAPLALKIFLLTLAIVDDIGAITIIALFYAEVIHYGYLTFSLSLMAALFLLRHKLGDKLALMIIASIVLWVTTHLSGVHASIVGAIIGLITPIHALPNKVSLSESVEKAVLPFSTSVVLPIFAFANAGFVISAQAFTSNPSVFWGILLGLVVGKVVGITLAAWLLLKFRVAELPRGVTMRHVTGVGFLAGIGFTVSIFITELAFTDSQHMVEAAKAGVFVGSFASAILGSLLLVGRFRRTRLNRE